MPGMLGDEMDSQY